MTILLLLFENFRKLDGSKAPDGLSSFAVRLLKENLVVIQVKHYVRMAQISRKSKPFEVRWKFRKHPLVRRMKPFNSRQTQNRVGFLKVKCVFMLENKLKFISKVTVFDFYNVIFVNF